MKIRKIVKAFLPLAAILSSTATFAGDNPVNCHNVTRYQAIYNGTASCEATYWDNNNGLSFTRISQYYFDTTIQHQFLTGTVWGSDYRTYSVSCWVDVPFSHYDQIVSQECDYTPKASITLSSIGNTVTGRVGIANRASDRDGNIVKTEWWVDGVYKGTTKPTVTTTEPKTFSIRQKVTDNDGYTDEVTRSIYIDLEELDLCNKYVNGIYCPDFNK